MAVSIIPGERNQNKSIRRKIGNNSRPKRTRYVTMRQEGNLKFKWQIFDSDDSDS